MCTAYKYRLLNCTNTSMNRNSPCPVGMILDLDRCLCRDLATASEREWLIPRSGGGAGQPPNPGSSLGIPKGDYGKIIDSTLVL